MNDKPGASSCRAADEVRAGNQSKGGEADRVDHTTQCFGKGGSSPKMTVGSEQRAVSSKNWEKNQ
jgi:hypothetical protein